MSQVAATTPRTVDLEVGDDWCIGIDVPAGSSVAVLVTAPDDTTATPTPVVTGGSVSVVVPLAQAGRYLAVLTVSGDVNAVEPFTAYAAEPTTAGQMPTLAEVKAYLSSNGETSWPDASISEALAAETAAQRAVCDVPPAYPDDLREALKRRVARNLAARRVPIAQITSFDGTNVSTQVTRYDAEVDRLEGPHRKVVLA